MENRAAFLAALAKIGHVHAAATTAGILRRQSVYEWRDADPTFAQDWDEALEVYTQTLEAEADRRGVHGVPEPVYYKGEVVGEVKKYSDVLLMFRLNGLRPERYRQRHEHTGKDGEALSMTVNVKFTLAEAIERAYTIQRDRALPGGTSAV